MSKVHEITNIQDLDILFSLSIGKVYIIKFSALWCKPCQDLKERYLQLSKNCNNLVFLNIDTDNDNSNDQLKISDYFNINTLPTILVIKSVGNLPSSKEVNKLILHRTEGKDLSSLIYFINNLNYDMNYKQTNKTIPIDRFQPPNIIFNREIGYDSDLGDNVYGKIV